MLLMNKNQIFLQYSPLKDLEKVKNKNDSDSDEYDEGESSSNSADSEDESVSSSDDFKGKLGKRVFRTSN